MSSFSGHHTTIIDSICGQALHQSGGMGFEGEYYAQCFGGVVVVVVIDADDTNREVGYR